MCCGTGTITGKRVGQRIEYRWEEEEGQSGGMGVWLIQRDGSLRGTWGFGNSSSDGGEWNLSPVATQLADSTALR